MPEPSTRAVAPIDGRKVQPIGATVPQPHHERADTKEADASTAAADEAETPPVAVSDAGHRTTDLAYQVDAESKRVSVQVVDRATGEVVRSFPVFVPGQAAIIDGQPNGDVSEEGESDAPRGALVDAKV